MNYVFFLRLILNPYLTSRVGYRMKWNRYNEIIAIHWYFAIYFSVISTLFGSTNHDLLYIIPDEPLKLPLT